MLISFALILTASTYRHEGAVRSAYCVLFSVGLGVAYALKLGLALPESSVFMPFNKLYSISEYGSTGLAEDIWAYAMPYIFAGFLFMPALPRFKVAGSFMAGVIAALCSRVYHLLEGGSFVTDEYLFAGLGMAAGCALYILFAYALRLKIDFKEFKLPLPKRTSFIWSLIILIGVYIGIALMMIFGYSEPYSDIVFAQSAYPLPEDITLSCSLDDSADKQLLFIPSEQPLEERLTAVAQSVGIYSNITSVSGSLVAEGEAGKVTMTESGSWVYESYAQLEGDIPTADSAVNAVFSFFSTRQILSTDIDSVTDIIERIDESTGLLTGYDIYLSSAVNGHSIVGSCSIVACVRAGNSIVKIRRYDGDIQTGAQLSCISQEKAFSLATEGKCANTLTSPAVSATVNGCELVYMQNGAQGFYLPVWSFDCTATLEDGSAQAFSIYVQADS